MDNQIILALSVAMDKIEKKYPNNYRLNAKWVKMNVLREKYCILLAEKEIEYHKKRFERTKDIASKDKMEQYQKYINKYKNKGDDNGNTSVLR